MPRAFLNGEFIPADQAVVPVYDAGFMLGVTVAEQLRTFDGQLFQLDKHLARLWHSLEIVGVDPGLSIADVQAAALDLAARNHAELATGDDLGLSIFVTPGPYPAMVEALGSDVDMRPRVCMHTFPLPFRLWAEKYEHGQALVLTDIRQVPGSCWPTELKCRSRMHYYLADHHARQKDPQARALLLDHEDHVLEASTANIVVYRRDEGLLSPPLDKILPGVSVAVLSELAVAAGHPVTERDLTVDDVASADEVMLCSTSPCVWPVTRLEGRPIGNGHSGPIFSQLLKAWSDRVGISILEQAQRFSSR